MPSPSGPNPPAGAPGSAPGWRTRHRWGPLIGLAALLLALVVGGVFAVRALNRPDTTVTDPARPTGSSWNDGSTSPSPTPTPSRPPSGSENPAPLVACPTGAPLARVNYPADGRIHGGGLSMAPVPGYTERGDEIGLSWTYDAASQSQITEPNWISLFAVASLRIADGFTDPHQAADGVMHCETSSAGYLYFTHRQDLQSRTVTVDGHPGWALRSNVYVNDPGLSVPGDVVEVVVVDLGAGESLATFIGCAPIGDSRRIALLDATIADLRAS